MNLPVVIPADAEKPGPTLKLNTIQTLNTVAMVPKSATAVHWQAPLFKVLHGDFRGDLVKNTPNFASLAGLGVLAAQTRTRL